MHPREAGTRNTWPPTRSRAACEFQAHSLNMRLHGDIDDLELPGGNPADLAVALHDRQANLGRVGDASSQSQHPLQVVLRQSILPHLVGTHAAFPNDRVRISPHYSAAGSPAV